MGAGANYKVTVKCGESCRETMWFSNKMEVHYNVPLMIERVRENWESTMLSQRIERMTK